jgi:hypothetical protein
MGIGAAGHEVSEILFPALGVAVLAGVGTDVFMTVFNPAEYGGPLTRRQNRLLWAAARRLGRGREGRRRHYVLALAAPVMAVTTVFVWIMLLIVGFGLIYLPWMNTFLVSPGHLRAPWLEAFYFSASTATTLSIGDLVPNVAPLRLLAPFETLTGAALLTAVLQYTISISQYGLAMAATSMDIAVHFAGGEAPESVAERVRRAEEAAGWGEWCDTVSRSLLTLWQALTRYPILNYFHPPGRSEALPVQLESLLRLRWAVLRAPEPGPLARHPGFVAMCRSVEWYLIAVDRHFLPGEHAAGRDRSERRTVEQAYRRLLEHTGYVGEMRDGGAEAMAVEGR